MQKILSNRAVWYIAPTVLLFSSFIVLIYSGNIHFSWSAIQDGFNSDFGFYVLVGLGAQLVDGTLGMAYGVTSTSFLLSLGVPPAVSSTSVHVAEMFTTGASAISHFKFGNINKKLFRNLLIPGVLGSITGAYLLADFMKLHPGVELVLDVSNRANVTLNLERNETDFSLVSVLPDRLNLEEIPCMKNQLFLVGNTSLMIDQKNWGSSQ